MWNWVRLGLEGGLGEGDLFREVMFGLRFEWGVGWGVEFVIEGDDLVIGVCFLWIDFKIDVGGLGGEVGVFIVLMGMFLFWVWVVEFFLYCLWVVL